MSRTYMPRKMWAQVAWSKNLATLISAQGANYGIPAAQTAAFITQNASLQAAWTASEEPTTRNKITITARDTALKAMKTLARPLVSTIRGNTALSAATLEQLGIPPYKTTRSRATIPQDSPFIVITKMVGRRASVELRKASASRGKPAGVSGATILVRRAGESNFAFLENTTRTTLDVDFGSGEAETVYLTAFWSNTRDQSGPAAEPVAVNLPAGGLLANEAATADSENVKLAA